MRKGANPAKLGVPAYKPKKLGIATFTYIPFQSGYFQDVLKIFKIMLASLYENTKEGFDLLVFDNGSCPEVRSVLECIQSEGLITWLILSKHNLSKVGALNWIFQSMPNEWICVSDSDVLFREGWFSESMKIAQSFPEVGMIGAQPSFFDVLNGKGNAHLKNQDYNHDTYNPDKWVTLEYCQALGMQQKRIQLFLAKDLPVIINPSTGAEAVVGASHMQFLSPREVLNRIGNLPITYSLNREDMIEIDKRMEQMGLMHLSTKYPHVLHMGNIIDDNLKKEIANLPNLNIIKPGVKEPIQKRSLIGNLLREINKLTFANRVFMKLYKILFEILSD